MGGTRGWVEWEGMILYYWWAQTFAIKDVCLVQIVNESNPSEKPRSHILGTSHGRVCGEGGRRMAVTVPGQRFTPAAWRQGGAQQTTWPHRVGREGLCLHLKTHQTNNNTIKRQDFNWFLHPFQLIILCSFICLLFYFDIVSLSSLLLAWWLEK